MTSHQNILLSLSRLPRGVRFVSLGRINRQLTELQSDLGTVRCSFLELHTADGSVRGFAPQDLTALRDAAQRQVEPGFLVAFTADQHASLSTLDQRPNLYAALEADEMLCGSPGHQPRFLSPRALRDHLHTYRAASLNPDNYAHRLSEIDAASATAPDVATAGKIRRFRSTAAKYLAAADDKAPEGKFWTTDRSFLREDSTRMPREVVPCPSVEPPVDAALAEPAQLATDENARLPHSPAESASGESHPTPTSSQADRQFTLAI